MNIKSQEVLHIGGAGVLAEMYGKRIKSAVAVTARAWFFDHSGEQEFQFRLWVDKTLTHYDFATAEDLLKCLRRKILLHERFGENIDTIR